MANGGSRAAPIQRFEPRDLSVVAFQNPIQRYGGLNDRREGKNVWFYIKFSEMSLTSFFQSLLNLVKIY